MRLQDFKSKKQCVLALNAIGFSQVQISRISELSPSKVNTIIHNQKYNGVRFPSIKRHADEKGLTAKQMQSFILDKLERNPRLLEELVK